MITQIGLFSFGLLTIILLSSKQHKYSRWGWIAGIAGTYFYVVTAVTAETLGLLALSIVYFVFYLRGFYNHFIKGDKDDKD